MPHGKIESSWSFNHLKIKSIAVDLRTELNKNG